jgi:hypothetical protein
MTGSIFALDLGTNIQFTEVFLGPSIGKVLLPVQPELLVTSAAPLVLCAYASRVLLQAAVTSVTLPLCATWMTAPNLQNRAAFDRSLWIKDLGGNASFGAPIVVTPAGSDTIDGLASYSITTPNELLRLNPLSTGDGWFVG